MFLRFTFALASMLCVVLVAQGRPAPPLNPLAELIGHLSWRHGAAWFGGFSGLEISPDGKRFVAITDRAYVVRGQLERRDDKITGIAVTDHFPMLDTDGRPLNGNRSDSEGLAIAADGRMFVSFELLHRVFVFPTPEGIPDWAAHHNGFNPLAKNGSLEALAVDAQGRLYTLPETMPGRADFPVFRHQRQGSGQYWDQPFDLPRRDGFAPVGADFGPDGRLYLLERALYPMAFRSRVRAFTLDGDRILDEDVVLETRLGAFGNLEGLAVWRDATGAMRLTMIADNNFLPIFPTQMVEYRLKE